jgi:hypothetical protein
MIAARMVAGVIDSLLPAQIEVADGVGALIAAALAIKLLLPHSLGGRSGQSPARHQGWPMTHVQLINAGICLLLALCLMVFRRDGSTHRPLVSLLAYLLIVSAGVSPY